jgi:hypothetical protein
LCCIALKERWQELGYADMISALESDLFTNSKKCFKDGKLFRDIKQGWGVDIARSLNYLKAHLFQLSPLLTAQQ